MSGEPAPGAVIRDAELAERVGLPRTPVREALARLADDGLVETKPHSWTRVRPLVIREIRDALVVVPAMHELAVRLSVPLMTAKRRTEGAAAAWQQGCARRGRGSAHHRPFGVTNTSASK